MLRLGVRLCGSSALLSVILAGLAAAAAAASSDLFDNQLGDINYCKKQCQLTIKNKSPAKVSSGIPFCCSVGCLCGERIINNKLAAARRCPAFNSRKQWTKWRYVFDTVKASILE